VPNKNTSFRQKPQINLSTPSTARIWLVSLCAFFCILQSALSDNGQSLVIALVAIITAVLTEIFLTFRNYKFLKILDGSAIATALILTMLLPNLIHPVYAAFGCIFAIVVVKYSFGGLGSNWLNPALGGWLFIRFSWPSVYSATLTEYIPSTTEMVVTHDVSSIDNSVATFLNDTVFSIVDVQLPLGYIDLLFADGPGIIADRGLFALLLGTIVITAIGINRGWVPLVFISVYVFFVRLAGDASGAWGNGDILYSLFSGGTIAVAFILAAEPSSSAKLRIGVLLAVILGAVLSWFFRYRCMEYAGCFIALSLVNCLTPLIRLQEEKIVLYRNNIGEIHGDSL
jgi:electron transport complex protein RnfD